VPLVQVVKGLEVCRFLRDDGEVVCSREAKVDLVILASQPNTIIGRANHPMPSLSKEVGQEIGIRAVVKIQVECQGQTLPA
jgi:ribosomal protein S3